MKETVHEIWLSLAIGQGGPFRKLFETFEDARGVWEADPEELSSAGLPERLVRRLEDRDLARAAETARFCEKNGVKTLVYGDPRYPAKLAGIPNPPYLLYVSGDLPEVDGRLSLAVVGTREMTGYGMRAGYRTAYEAASAGAVIISGMAKGIDGTAAAGAIEAGGKTVAVIGCGIDIAYPKEHARLMDAISGNGAVISEYPPSSPPLAGHFPVRNRIISGLSDGVFVVEAGLKSGAMLTADIAKNQGRDVFALPGRTEDALSAGPNLLIRDGAFPVIDTGDILSRYAGRYSSTISAESYARSTVSSDIDDTVLGEFGLTGAAGVVAASDDAGGRKKSLTVTDPAPAGRQNGRTRMPPEGELRDFYLLIPRGERVSADFFVPRGYSAESAMRLLTLLEISGFVTGIPGGMYVL